MQKLQSLDQFNENIAESSRRMGGGLVLTGCFELIVR